MNRFFLFTVGPLLLSVKGIIDLAQMPPTILLPHPGGTGNPTLERIAYLPGAQPPFPHRAFNPTSISSGEDPSLPYPSPTCCLIFPAVISVFPHTSLSAALHLPEMSTVSSPCPLSDESSVIILGGISLIFFLWKTNRMIFCFGLGCWAEYLSLGA